MTQVSDEQIIALMLEVDAGKKTITQGCKELHICRKTYHNRRNAILGEKEELHNLTHQISKELPLTINSLLIEARNLLSKTKEMDNEAQSFKDQLAVKTLLSNLITRLISALQKAETYIDNRSITITNIKQMDEQDQVRLYESVLKQIFVDVRKGEIDCPFRDSCKIA